jgi:4-amino-4-deoxy-L-arabinose transferase
MNLYRNICLWLGCYALYYIVPAIFRPLWQPDETRYAEISREMLHGQSWISPHFFGLRYFEKPVLGYWVNNFGQWLFGETHFGVRFGVIISTTLSGLIVYWLGKNILASRRQGLIAALIYLTSLLVFATGTYATLDPILCLWLTAAMSCYWQTTQAKTRFTQLLAFGCLGIFIGFGFMTKGFLAIAVPIIAILPWALTHQPILKQIRRGLFAIVVAVLVSLPWVIQVQIHSPDFWHYFFWVEHVQRFSSPDAQHKAPFWYYIPALIAGCLPWLGLLPSSLKLAWQRRKENSGLLYLLSWVVMPLFFFSLANGKLITYILPCFAPLAILMAAAVEKSQAEGGLALRANSWINFSFAIVALVALYLINRPASDNSQLYDSNQLLQYSLAIFAFIAWGAAALCSRRYWWCAAFCPIILTVVLGYALPDKVRYGALPEQFIKPLMPKLEKSNLLVTNNPGVGAMMAWMLQRNNVYFYQSAGELSYGTGYQDSQGRFIPTEKFSQWLESRRCLNTVSVLLRLPLEDEELSLPKPTYVKRQGKFVYAFYDKYNGTIDGHPHRECFFGVL